MSRKILRELELKIVGTFVDATLAAGYKLSVSLDRGHDVDEMLHGSTDRERIMSEAFAGDDAHLFVIPGDKPALVNGRINSIGWAYAVLGNDGWDVISDYSTNLDDLGLMAKAMEISNAYAQ